MASVSASGVVAVSAQVTDIISACQGMSGGITVNVPAPYAQSGVGDNVFTIPSYVTRIRIQDVYSGGSSNFIGTDRDAPDRQ